MALIAALDQIDFGLVVVVVGLFFPRILFSFDLGNDKFFDRIFFVKLLFHATDNGQGFLLTP